MHKIQEKAMNHKVFMKILRPWPGRSGYLEKFSDLSRCLTFRTLTGWLS
jgi:hypothetical protein